MFATPSIAPIDVSVPTRAALSRLFPLFPPMCGHSAGTATTPNIEGGGWICTAAARLFLARAREHKYGMIVAITPNYPQRALLDNAALLKIDPHAPKVMLK